MKRMFAMLVVIAGLTTIARAGGAGKWTSAKFDIDLKMKPKMGAMGKQGKGAPQMPSEIPMPLKVWIKDTKNSRTEMDMSAIIGHMGKGKAGGMPTKAVTLVDNGTTYMLNEARKEAVKVVGAGGMGGMGMGPLGGMESMFANASSWDPKMLEQMGLKKSGSSKIGKDAVDVYKGKFKPPGAGGSPMGGMEPDATVYLRKSDSFPMKMEVMTPMVDMTMNFKNIVKNPKLDPAMFKLPKGYTVNDMGAMMGKMGGGKMGGPPMGKK